MSAIQITRASVVDGIQKEKPVKSKKKAMSGKVLKRRLRRPKVSIVYKAGIAKRKLMTPNPREAASADWSEKPEFEKMLLE
ncbi:hypothetical protein SLS60_004116 [Paraconiothyrium brasiliense]|uniref:Uncharacterized protein n=1 Tax=Paraconiothyrium brasiliense TaxID=300254 RepID=A0ABR3RQK1_9PLEO